MSNIIATVNFVRMCFEANEIQKRRQITVGNNYFDIVNKGIFIVGNKSRNKKVFNIFNNDIRNKKRFIWLPRVMQLQEIYWHFFRKQKFYKTDQKPAFLTDLSLYLGNYMLIKQFANIPFYSLAEILLAVVMLDIYQKQWNGTNFIEIKTKKKKKKKGKDEKK